jgi:hypothetical protein
MRVRRIEVLRAVWGGAMLFAPGPVLRRIHGVRVDGPSLAVARVLGARHLAQATLSGLEPTAAVLALGVWVDSVHAASAVGLAVVDKSRVRAGLTDAVVAGAWASFGYRDLHGGAFSAPSREQTRSALARRVLGWVPGGSLLSPKIGHASS